MGTENGGTIAFGRSQEKFHDPEKTCKWARCLGMGHPAVQQPGGRRNHGGMELLAVDWGHSVSGGGPSKAEVSLEATLSCNLQRKFHLRYHAQARICILRRLGTCFFNLACVYYAMCGGWAVSAAERQSWSEDLGVSFSLRVPFQGGIGREPTIVQAPLF